MEEKKITSGLQTICWYQVSGIYCCIAPQLRSTADDPDEVNALLSWASSSRANARPGYTVEFSVAAPNLKVDTEQGLTLATRLIGTCTGRVTLYRYGTFVRRVAVYRYLLSY